MGKIDFTFLAKLRPLPDQQRIELLFGNPSAFSVDYVNGVQQKVKELPLSERQELQLDLDWLRKFITGLTNNSIPYPIGFGPIEQLWSRFENGEITRLDAIKLA